MEAATHEGGGKCASMRRGGGGEREATGDFEGMRTGYYPRTNMMMQLMAVLFFVICGTSAEILPTSPALHEQVRQGSYIGAIRLRGGGGERKFEVEHRLFVANLPKTLNDEGLKKAFEPFGKVLEAKVHTYQDQTRGILRVLQVMLDIETGMSRRMGYVKYADGRSVLEAIEEMHDTVMLAACDLVTIAVLAYRL